MSKTITLIMDKRQKDTEQNNESKEFPTFSAPKIVAEPKTEKEKKEKKMLVNQEKTEIALEKRYLDNQKKLLPRDLATIHRPDFYRNDKKKERRYNNCVIRAKQDLDLLSFLLEMLRPRYRHQILLSENLEED